MQIVNSYPSKYEISTSKPLQSLLFQTPAASSPPDCPAPFPSHKNAASQLNTLRTPPQAYSFVPLNQLQQGLVQLASSSTNPAFRKLPRKMQGPLYRTT